MSWKIVRASVLNLQSTEIRKNKGILWARKNPKRDNNKLLVNQIL